MVGNLNHGLGRVSVHKLDAEGRIRERGRDVNLQLGSFGARRGGGILGLDKEGISVMELVLLNWRANNHRLALLRRGGNTLTSAAAKTATARRARSANAENLRKAMMQTNVNEDEPGETRRVEREEGAERRNVVLLF